MQTILLIEDNLDILDNLTEYFELQGYKIAVANNGQAGVKLAQEHIPDLIICDTKMPHMDGYEVLHQILQFTKTHEIPFIFSTSNSEVVDRAKALELGADDYIVKPFEPETLLAMAKKWLKSGSKRHASSPPPSQPLLVHPDL
jgi:DNA-binding response OmpR family regulator